MLVEMATHEPRRRPGDADSSRRVPQSQSLAVRRTTAATRAPTCRSGPSTCTRCSRCSIASATSSELTRDPVHARRDASTAASSRRSPVTIRCSSSARPGGSTTARKACCASASRPPRPPASTTPSASTTTRARSCRFRRGTIWRDASIAAILARLVAEHRIDEDEAAQVAVDLAYRLPKQAYKL